MRDEFDWCMRHKCKSCMLDDQCKLLNGALKFRLLYRPFEELPEIMKKKGMKYGNRTR